MQQAPLDFTPVQWASTDVTFSLVRHALLYVHNLGPCPCCEAALRIG